MQSYFRALVQRASFIFAGLVLSLTFLAATAQASCPQRSTIDLLKFALANAPSNFSAIRGSAEGGGGPYTQYTLTPAAERFCPHHFILQHDAAFGARSEDWEMRFSVSSPSSESDNDIADGALKQFSPILKSKGFTFGGYANGVTGLQLLWDGPSNTVVWVHTYAADEETGDTDAGFEIYVRHLIK